MYDPRLYTLYMNDPAARIALEVYAVEVAKDNPELANYIWKVYLNRAQADS